MTLKVNKGLSGIHQLFKVQVFQGKIQVQRNWGKQAIPRTKIFPKSQKTVTGNDRENNLVGTKQSALNHLFLNSTLQRQVF